MPDSTAIRPVPRWAGPVATGWTLSVVAGLLAWVGVADMPWLDLIAATVVVVVTNVVPGVVLWRLVRPREGWWAEDLAMGFAVGSVVALLAQIPAGLLGMRWMSAAIVLGTTAAVLLIPGTRARVLSARTTRLPVWWWPLVSLAMLALVPDQRFFVKTNELAWAGTVRPHIDVPLHLALAGQLAERGPTTFPWVQSEALGYHWFSHAWMAQVGVTSGAELDAILLRFMPVLMIVVVPVAVAAAALRLTGKTWAGPLAALLAVAVGTWNAWGIVLDASPVSAISPTLGLAVPMLMALIVLLVVRWGGTAQSGAWVLVVLLAAGAAGTKGSATPLVLAGLGLAGLAMLVFNRKRALQIFVDGCLVAGALLVVVLTVFRGSGAGLHISLADASRQTWGGVLLGDDSFVAREVGALASALGVLTAAVIGLCLFAYPRWRKDPLSWLLLGAGLAGAGAIVVFGHPGNSQGYFAKQAAPIIVLLAVQTVAVLSNRWPRRQLGAMLLIAIPVGLLATWGPIILLGRLPPGDASHLRLAVMFGLAVVVLAVGAGLAAHFASRQRAVVALAAVGAALIVGGMSMNWDTLRSTQMLPPTSRPPTAEFGGIPRPTVQAARWIRDHSDRDDVVMTNRHCYLRADTADDGCDSRWMVVAAWSQRQMLVEGWTATPRSAEEGPDGRDSITVAYWEPDLLELNDGFIAEPTESAARELRDGYDVRWVLVDRALPHADPDDFAPYAELRARYRGIDIYEMRR